MLLILFSGSFTVLHSIWVLSVKRLKLGLGKKAPSKLHFELFPPDVPLSNVVYKMLASALWAESEMASLSTTTLYCLPVRMGIRMGFAGLHCWEEPLWKVPALKKISHYTAPNSAIQPLNMLWKTIVHGMCLFNHWSFTRIYAVNALPLTTVSNSAHHDYMPQWKLNIQSLKVQILRILTLRCAIKYLVYSHSHSFSVRKRE